MSRTEHLFSPRSNSTKWYVAVPVLTNPVLAMEILPVIVLILPLAACFILLVQFIMGGSVTPGHIAVAFRIGSYVSGGLLLSYVFIGGVILENRYLSFYEMTDTLITNDIMRCNEPFSLRRFFCATPWEVSPPKVTGKTSRKTLCLQEIQTVKTVPSVNLIMVSAKNSGGFMKIYCTDASMFAKVKQQLTRISGVQG